MSEVSSELEQVYRRHAPAAFRRALHLLENETDAYAVVHEVFMALGDGPQQLGPGMSTYLNEAVTHACVERIRRHATQVRPGACPSELLLDAWAAEDLEPRVAAQLTQHLSHCAACQARRVAHSDARSAFLQSAPSLSALQRRFVVAKAPVTARRSTRDPRLGLLGGFALLGAVVALLTLQPWKSAPAVSTQAAPRLGFSIQRGQQVIPGRSGAQVQSGDVVRLAYSTPSDAYLAVLEVDARSVSAYFPSTGTTAARVRGGNDIALDVSVLIDDQPGVERVLGVFCRAPVDLRPLSASLREAGALPSGLDCHADELQLMKR